MWIYGIRMWDTMHRYTSKLCKCSQVICNSDLNHNAHKMVREVIRETAPKYAETLHNNVIAEARNIAESRNIRRRLKRSTFDELSTK